MRVVAFIVLFLLIVAGAAAAIVWYARSSYFVGLQGQQIVIYQGRPGGVLGMDPTLQQRTQYTTSDVLPASVPTLKSGQEEPSLSSAQQYVQNLVTAYNTAQAAAGATTTTSPTTTSPTTTPATTTTPPTAAHPAAASTTTVRP